MGGPSATLTHQGTFGGVPAQYVTFEDRPADYAKVE